MYGVNRAWIGRKEEAMCIQSDQIIGLEVQTSRGAITYVAQKLDTGFIRISSEYNWETLRYPPSLIK